MREPRRVIAALNVSDYEAGKYDKGTIEYLEDVINGSAPVPENGEKQVEVVDAFIDDGEEAEIESGDWGAGYRNYLMEFAFDLDTEHPKSPLSYKKWADSQLPF